MFKKITFLLLNFLLLTHLWSWGSHYLITLRSLEHPDMAFLDKEVPTEELEDFIKKEREGLYQLFKEYYEWHYKFNPKRMNPDYLKNPFDKEKADLQAFLRSARLNPKARFLLVNRVLPGQKPKYKVVPIKEVYPYYKDVGFFFQFEDVKGKKVSLRSILVTFADEPDWIMDHHLWEIKEYGYGEQPYGEPEGESSKAPFHMLFMHEPWIVQVSAPYLLEGMTIERIVLFTKLAKFAKETGHEYWAHRFLAWAIHYYQDLAQPYHAKAVPEANFWYYTKYIFSWDKKGFQQRTTQLLKNKHFIYEDFVSVYLEKSLTEPDSITDSLCYALRKNPIIFEDYKKYLKNPDYYKVIYDLTKYSSDHAYQLDKNIQEIFGYKYTQDPGYDLERDPEYKITNVITQLSENKKNLLLQETDKDFQNTGQITRFAVLDLHQKEL
ncbi:MAG: hypothetical protein KatS3mg129_1057 [Leptospiraceae bacterium]|nr:MAG: hypothetical protein KatS3mg129_1057 [Leptospiraceae bacterium]